MFFSNKLDLNEPSHFISIQTPRGLIKPKKKFYKFGPLKRKADAVVHMTHTEYRKVINFLADGGGSFGTSPKVFPVEPSAMKILQSLGPML